MGRNKEKERNKDDNAGNEKKNGREEGRRKKVKNWQIKNKLIVTPWIRKRQMARIKEEKEKKRKTTKKEEKKRKGRRKRNVKELTQIKKKITTQKITKDEW